MMCGLACVLVCLGENLWKMSGKGGKNSVVFLEKANKTYHNRKAINWFPHILKKHNWIFPTLSWHFPKIFSKKYKPHSMQRRGWDPSESGGSVVVSVGSKWRGDATNMRLLLAWCGCKWVRLRILCGQCLDYYGVWYVMCFYFFFLLKKIINSNYFNQVEV